MGPKRSVCSTSSVPSTNTLAACWARQARATPGIARASSSSSPQPQAPPPPRGLQVTDPLVVRSNAALAAIPASQRVPAVLWDNIFEYGARDYRGILTAAANHSDPDRRAAYRTMLPRTREDYNLALIREKRQAGRSKQVKRAAQIWLMTEGI
jgi:hypothetical protein